MSEQHDEVVELLKQVLNQSLVWACYEHIDITSAGTLFQPSGPDEMVLKSLAREPFWPDEISPSAGILAVAPYRNPCPEEAKIDLSKAVVFVATGAPGVGKTRMATMLVEQTGLTCIEPDSIIEKEERRLGFCISRHVPDSVGEHKIVPNSILFLLIKQEIKEQLAAGKDEFIIDGLAMSPVVYNFLTQHFNYQYTICLYADEEVRFSRWACSRCILNGSVVSEAQYNRALYKYRRNAQPYLDAERACLAERNHGVASSTRYVDTGMAPEIFWHGPLVRFVMETLLLELLKDLEMRMQESSW